MATESGSKSPVRQAAAKPSTRNEWLVEYADWYFKDRILALGFSRRELHGVLAHTTTAQPTAAAARP